MTTFQALSSDFPAATWDLAVVDLGTVRMLKDSGSDLGDFDLQARISATDRAPSVRRGLRRVDAGRASDGLVSLYVTFARRAAATSEAEAGALVGLEPGQWGYIALDDVAQAQELREWAASQPRMTIEAAVALARARVAA